MHNQQHIKKALARTLYHYRLARNLKREYVAQALGVSKSTIDKMEQGAHPLRFADVHNYCCALQVPFASFLADYQNELNRLSGFTAIAQAEVA